ILPEFVYAKVSSSCAFACYFGRLGHDKSLQMSQTKRAVCTQEQQDTESRERAEIESGAVTE
ncbi:uncharacterized, partial [Tachysurus ichikawai]